MSYIVRVMTMYRIRWKEQLMFMLNQCNGGISILMITMMTVVVHTKVRCTQSGVYI